MVIYKIDMDEEIYNSLNPTQRAVINLVVSGNSVVCWKYSLQEIRDVLEYELAIPCWIIKVQQRE